MITADLCYKEAARNVHLSIIYFIWIEENVRAGMLRTIPKSRSVFSLVGIMHMIHPSKVWGGHFLLVYKKIFEFANCI